MPFESVWRRIAPEAYFEVSVAMANSLEKSGRWRMEQERKSFLSLLKDCWQAGVQSHQLSFLVRSRRGQATVE